MAEIMTSRAEAKLLGDEISMLVDRLERMGFTRAVVGSAMAGVALGIVQAHVTHSEALRMVETLRDVLTADQSTKQ